MWWKILIAIVALPFALGAVLAIIGLLVPVGHTATRRVSYAAPAERVWAIVSDFASHASWRDDVKAMTHVEDRDGQPVREEVHEGGDRFRLMVIETEPPRRMVTRIVDNRQFGGTWTWDIEARADGGCALTITEDGEVYNPVFRTLRGVVFDPRTTMDGVHRSLAKELGEQIELE